MTTGRGELWREIGGTRLAEPAFEGMAARGSTSMLAVPRWMDEGHLGKLAAILRWGTNDRVVKVFENAENVEERFDGVAILRDEPAGQLNRAVDADGQYAYGRVKDGDTTAQLTHSTQSSLLNGSNLIKGVIGERGANSSEAARRLWHKLSVVESSLPVSDPVYLVEAMDILLADPEADPADVGMVLLVEHVKNSVDAREQGAVIEIIRRVIERRTAVLTVGEKGVTVKGAQALDRAHLGRYERGPADHAGKHEMQLVAVDSPLVRSVISSTNSRYMADKLKKKVLGVLDGA